MDSRKVFLLYGLLAILIRFPFFFRDYIDRDESTFILMGESWLHGHLPYTVLWDLKPPLVYLFFAGIIYLFGKSFIAIRMAGVLAVSVMAFFTFALGKEFYSSRSAFFAGIACVYLTSLFGSLQGVMSEHLSMLAFMPGLYLLVKQKNAWYVLAAGFFMGIALMLKLNLAYAAALLGIFPLIDPSGNKSFLNRLSQAILFGGGLVTIIALTWLPYALKGLGLVWWKSVVLAPLAYTEAGGDPIIKMAPIVILVALFLFLGIRKKWLDPRLRGVQLLSLALVGIVLSFIKGGRLNGHYLIQFHPVFLVLLAGVLEQASPRLKFNMKPWVALVLLILPLESYLEYYSIFKNKIERGTFYNGEGFTVPAYLKAHHLQTGDVFFLEYHIGYWFLPAHPPTKAATHPSNLCREELFPYFDNPRKTSMEELSYIMDTLRPALVVTRYQRRIFDKKKESENDYMVGYLAQHYQVIARVDQAEIHQRSD